MATRVEGHQETLQTTNQVLVSLLEKQNEIQAIISRPVEIADKPSADAEEDLFELF